MLFGWKGWPIRVKRVPCKNRSLLFFRLRIAHAAFRPGRSYEVLNGQKGVIPQFEVGNRNKDTLLYTSQYSLTLKLKVAYIFYDYLIDSLVTQ